MPSDKSDAGYADMVAQAEEAVKSVKDPELKRVAFEKVLDALLSSQQTATKPTLTAGKKPGKQGSTKTTQKQVAGGMRKALSQKGPKVRVEELIDDGFFKKQRTLADVKAELANRGFHIPTTSLSGPLQTLTRERRIRRQKQSTGGKGAKETFAYSNW